MVINSRFPFETLQSCFESNFIVQEYWRAQDRALTLEVEDIFDT